MGALTTRAEPTRAMIEAANRAGSYAWPFNGEAFPRIQIIRVAELLNGRRLRMPVPLMPHVTAPRHVPAWDQLSLDEGAAAGRAGGGFLRMLGPRLL